MNKKLKVAIITISPSVAHNVQVLSPSPYVLTSYVNWKFQKEKINSYIIHPIVFESFDKHDIICQRLLKEKYDVIAFSIYIWNSIELIEIAKTIKLSLPNCLIIFGGPQVSPVAENIISKYKFIDIIPYITINGEIIFYNILKNILKSNTLDNIPNIYYRKNNKILKSKEKLEKLDFDSIPSPYIDGTIKFEEGKKYQAVIESSRGCPFECSYCFWGTGSNKMSYYKTDRTVKEVEFVYTNPSVTEVYFADSDFLIRPSRSVEILDSIIKYGGNRVLSSFEIDANSIKENKKEAILKLAKIPNAKINYAVQTTTKKALNLIGKRATAENFRRSLKLVKSWTSEIEIFVDIMLPLPGDTLAGFLNTLDFALELKPIRLNINYPLYLLPGTKYFDERKSLGIKCTPSPTFNVIETTEFPKRDIEQAFKIGFWTQVFTYYLPSVAELFYNDIENLLKGMRIKRILIWIDLMNDFFDIFGCYEDLIMELTLSVKQLNLIKGNALKKVCMPNNVCKILKLIIKNDDSLNTKSLQNLQNTLDIFDEISKNYSGVSDPYEYIRNSNQEMIKKVIPRFSFKKENDDEA